MKELIKKIIGLKNCNNNNLSNKNNLSPKCFDKIESPFVDTIFAFAFV